MSEMAQKLRALVATGEHFLAGEAYSALTGRIVEHVGFKAAYLGGHACSAFHYAVPDNGVFSQVEQLDQASRIAAAISRRSGRMRIPPTTQATTSNARFMIRGNGSSSPRWKYIPENPGAENGWLHRLGIPSADVTTTLGISAAHSLMIELTSALGRSGMAITAQ